MIRRIGQQLGAFTVQGPAARLIAAPLLGAGAGGLQSEVVVQALRDELRISAHSDAVLQISILHEPVYKRVRDSLGLRSPTELDETTNETAQREQQHVSRFASLSVTHTHRLSMEADGSRVLGTFLETTEV